jgi:hypothetical protein
MVFIRTRKGAEIALIVVGLHTGKQASNHPTITPTKKVTQPSLKQHSIHILHNIEI